MDWLRFRTLKRDYRLSGGCGKVRGQRMLPRQLQRKTLRLFRSSAMPSVERAETGSCWDLRPWSHEKCGAEWKSWRRCSARDAVCGVGRTVLSDKCVHGDTAAVLVLSAHGQECPSHTRLTFHKLLKHLVRVDG